MTASPVRLRDVALAAGTSTKTASRVINGFDGVAPDTRRRVQEAVESLGYQVDLMARSLRRGVDDTVGVVVPTLGDPFFALAIEEIEHMALQRDINLLVASNSRNADLERKVIDGLLARRVAGLIVVPFSADYSFLKHVSTPVVFLDRHPEGIDAGVVMVDDRGGARHAVEHLAAAGHQRIALITDDLTIKTSALRHQGYLDAMTALGLPTDPDLQVFGCQDEHQSEQRTLDLLNLEIPPTAIFSARSETSLGVVRALHQSGRTDVAFVSFGDFVTADLLKPAVTVIDHDPRMLARRAMERLGSRLDGTDDDDQDVIVPLHLLPRGSGELPVPGGSRRRLRSAAPEAEVG